MTMRAARATVTTTATRLDDRTTPPTVGGSILIKNPATSTGSVFIGGDTVTAHDGFEIEPGATVAIAATNWLRIYAVTTTGTVEVQLLESRA